MPYISKVCRRCLQSKPSDFFYAAPRMRDGYASWCKACASKKAIESLDKKFKDPRQRLFVSSQHNARNRGVEHTISVEDIKLPKVCKYLGITIDYSRSSEKGRLRAADSPSIDRIDPSRGYVPGNIQIISFLANQMKSNATIEQLLAFAEGVLRVHGD